MHALLSKKSKPERLGIEFMSDGIAVAVNNDVKPSEPPMFEWLEAEPQDHMRVLKSWVQKNKFTNAICNVVLNSDLYQTLLVEPPDVPEEELRGAIRWRLKDLVQTPVEQAVVDVFPLPQDGTRGNRKMVYVVVAEQTTVQEVVACIKQVGLHLNAIDIYEMAIRNVAYASIGDEQKDRGVAVAKLAPGSGSVLLFRQGNLYLTRSFKLDYKGGLLDEVPQDALALELQRSVDYYERQMGQAPPGLVYVCGENILADKIGSELRASFTAPVNHLMPAIANTEEEEAQNHALLQKGMGAIGGSLRERVA